jgi:hypothetical protein
VSPLERRYRWLLRAYPAEYRAGRGDEMLGTLLETAVPGQRRPGARESAALIAGGVRARAARNADMPVPASLRLAALLACATILSILLATSASRLSFGVRPAQMRYEWIAFGGLFAATTLIWFVRRELAALALLLAALAAGFSWDVRTQWLVGTVLVLAALTALRAERPPKAWLLWFCLPPAFFLQGMIPGHGGTQGIRLLTIVLAFAIIVLFLLGPLVWAVTDARPAFALATLLAFYAVDSMRGGYFNGWSVVCLAASVVAALPLLVRIVRRRRRAPA